MSSIWLIVVWQIIQLFVEGLIAFLIGRSRGFLVALWASGRVRREHVYRRPGDDLDPEFRRLQRWLRADQSFLGRRAGEFGRRSVAGTEDAFQAKWAQLNERFKPRMYLTRWPVDVLSRHGLASRQVDLAIDHIVNLFESGRIFVIQSAALSPVACPTVPKISYRHTICGALLLCRHRGWPGIPRSVLSAMVDSDSDWQTAEGGWRQTGETGTDLFASAYAAQFLALATEAADLSKSERGLAASALGRTLDHLEREWRKNGWSFENVVSEENAVLILIEVAEVFRAHRELLLGDLVRHLRAWLSPSGDLSIRYLAVPGLVRREAPIAALSTRVAFALLRCGEPREAWVALYNQAIGLWSGRAMNSADVSFLLDINRNLETTGRAACFVREP